MPISTNILHRYMTAFKIIVIIFIISETYYEVGKKKKIIDLIMSMFFMKQSFSDNFISTLPKEIMLLKQIDRC